MWVHGRAADLHEVRRAHVTPVKALLEAQHDLDVALIKTINPRAEVLERLRAVTAAINTLIDVKVREAIEEHGESFHYSRDED